MQIPENLTQEQVESLRTHLETKGGLFFPEDVRQEVDTLRRRIKRGQRPATVWQKEIVGWLKQEGH